MKRLWSALALRRQLLTAWYALCDREASWVSRVFAILVAGYVIDPIDLIPDVVPIVGWLDDLGLLGVAIWLLRRWLPVALIARAEAKADAALKRQNHWLRWVLLGLLLWLLFLLSMGAWLIWQLAHA
ncbi:YkvA family protein [Burkholderiaceae bacterium UC74_6]